MQITPSNCNSNKVNLLAEISSNAELVKSFSDRNAASIDRGLDYAAMGRYHLLRYIRIATTLVENQLPIVVVFQDDQGPQRPIFSGNPDPEPVPMLCAIQRRNGIMEVPVYRYYSNDLRQWVSQLRIPFPSGTTADMARRGIMNVAQCGQVVQMRGNTVYFASTFELMER